MTVNYRLTRNKLFPTPIHDVLAAFDWAVRHLTPTPAVPQPSRRDAYWREDDAKASPSATAKVGVVGTGVGGSLGLMLGLTECIVNERACVAAVSVTNPICDWSDLEANSAASFTAGIAGSKRASKSQNKSVAESSTPAVDSPLLLPTGVTNSSALDRRFLLHLRTSSFPPSSPWKYFDPFASPLLFLRTPSKDVPGPRSLEDEFTRLMLADDTDSQSKTESDGNKERQRRRKVPLKWPPPGSTGMVMPRMKITVPKDVGDNVIAAQGEEMTRLLRRALVRGSIAGRGVGDKFWASVEEDEEDEDESAQELSRIKEEADRWVELITKPYDPVSSHESLEEETRNLGIWFDRILR